MAYTHQDSPSDATDPTTLPPLPLPPGVSSRYVDCTTSHSLVFHILESLPDLKSSGAKPKLVLLCHGFPDLAYSWRKMLPLLSSQGYHAVAFDQRGFGRTFSRKPLTESSFSPLALIRDTVALVQALGYTSVSCVVGHDFGAVPASLCALARPDMFHCLVLMSHPSKGPPQLPFNTSPSYGEPSAAPPPPPPPMDEALAALPRPRKPYKWYYCEPSSNAEMTYPAGVHLHTFLRGYFHLKSADWDGNHPHRLEGWTSTELEKMPRYYVMDLADTMRQAVARDMEAEDPQTVASRSSRWLPDAELAVYVQEYGRTTFQGGLNWYKVLTQPEMAAEMEVWSGMKIPIPTVLICGKGDWGTYQVPGALEAMEQGKVWDRGCIRARYYWTELGIGSIRNNLRDVLRRFHDLSKRFPVARIISAGISF